MSGVIYGVGLGPGDPDLMSVRAHKLLTGARHVAFFRKKGRPGQARRLAGDLVPGTAVEHPMEYPVTTEIPFDSPDYKAALSDFYAVSVAHLRALSETGEDVVVLCEGDPFFYGSFMHLYTRLSGDTPVEVVPAITGMSAAWTATGVPITWGDDILTVLMGTLDVETLTARMRDADALVVMKIGRNLAKIRAALDAAGRAEDAWYVEHASTAQQRLERLSDIPEDHKAPYFSIIIAHGNGRRP